MSTASPPGQRIPAIVEAKLRSVGRRQTAIAWAGSTLWAAACLLALASASTTADWLSPIYDASGRLAATAAVLGLAAAAGAVIAAYRLRRRRSPAVLADRSVPSLQQRLMTVTGTTIDRRDDRLTRQMFRQVAAEASVLGTMVRPREVVGYRSLRPAIVAAILGLTLPIIMLAIDADRTAVLWQRFWSFGGDVTATQMVMITGDVAVAENDPVTLRIQTDGLRPRAAIADLTGRGGERESLVATTPGDGQFAWEIDPRQLPATYRIRAGDYQSPQHAIRILPRPRLQSLRLTLVPPPHLGRPETIRDHLPPRLVGIRGSRLRIEMQPDRNVDSLEIESTEIDGAGREQPVQSIEPSFTLDGRFEYEETLTTDRVLAIRLVSVDAVAAPHADRMRLEVLEDRPPTVQLTPPASLDAPPGAEGIDEPVPQIGRDETLEFQFRAEDDFGLQRLELVVYAEPAETQTGGESTELLRREIAIDPASGRRQADGTVVLDLADLNLADLDLPDGQSIRVEIEATDGAATSSRADSDLATIKPDDPMPREGDTQPVTSPPIRLIVRDPEILSRERQAAARSAPSGVPPARPAEASEQLREQLQSVLATLREVAAQLGDIQRSGDDPDVPTESLRGVNNTLGAIYQSSRETHLALVGLQLLNLSRTHIQPAVDRLTWVKQSIGADENDITQPDTHLAAAIRHVTSAETFLADVLQRFADRIRDEQLADGATEVAKIYEVYVEKAQRLMEQLDVDRNPLRRRRAIFELDDAYLQRRAEVERLRRDMMAEFARMLADDPRLLRRYLDSVRRNQTSLRDRLTEAAEAQWHIGEQLEASLAIDPARRGDLWTLFLPARAAAVDEMTRHASDIADRTANQLPLSWDAASGTARSLIVASAAVASESTKVSLQLGERMERGESPAPMTPQAQTLLRAAGDMVQLIERLQFDIDEESETTFLNQRLVETRQVAAMADQWLQTAGGIDASDLTMVLAVVQDALGRRTEPLLSELADLDGGLQTLFEQQESELPESIRQLADQLATLCQTIGHHQTAASYALTRNTAEAAAIQVRGAVDRLAEAETLFDKIRRQTVDLLDAIAVRSPTAADLQDPTLDAFLAGLEREPEFLRQLELGRRPTNLNIVTDWILWRREHQGDGQGGLNEVVDAAAGRQPSSQMEDTGSDGNTGGDDGEQPSARPGETAELRQMVEKSLQRLETMAADPNRDPASAEQIRRRIEQLRSIAEATDEEAAGAWRALARAERSAAAIAAIARGQPVPDEQWNKLLSTLEKGLWQVRGRTPPEGYAEAIRRYQTLLREVD